MTIRIASPKRKFFAFVVDILFIANYVLGSVAASYFAEWFDFGEVKSSEGWVLMAVAGVLCGCVVLILETRLHRKVGFWPRSLFLFLGRSMVVGVVCVATALAIAWSIAVLVLATLGYPGSLGAFIIIMLPFMTVYYGLIMAPFGIIVGLINGILFRLKITCLT